jgi:glucose-6-phosphate isomerase
VDAFSLDTWFDRLPPDKTLVVVVSKSGGTIETASQYFLAREWLKRHLGERWKDHVFLVTGQKGFLRDLANVQRLRSLPVPEELGGRYSVLSAVGLLPAAFMGLDIEAFVDGARSVLAPFAKPAPGTGGLAAHLAGHPAWNLAVWSRALWDKGYNDLIFYTYLPLWASFGDWFAQLWAESLGKDGKGSQPIPAVGVTDQHSVTQMFLDGPRNKACLFLTCPAQAKGAPFPDDLPPSFDYLRGKHFGDLLQAEALGTQMALSKHHVPLVEIRLGADTIRQAGKLVALTGLATILTGWLLDLNPLDQPAVELGKRLALARLGAPGLGEEKADLDAFLKAQAGGHAQEF